MDGTKDTIWTFVYCHCRQIGKLFRYLTKEYCTTVVQFLVFRLTVITPCCTCRLPIEFVPKKLQPVL